MKENAIISLVLPADKEAHALDLALTHKLYFRRITRVIPAPGLAVKRILLEIALSPGPCLEDELIIETGKRHQYSDEYKKLTGDFYLEKE